MAAAPDSCLAVQSRTKIAHKTLKPQWNEELHVLVQEPTTQLLRVEMFDHDTFNVKVGRTSGGCSHSHESVHDRSSSWRTLSRTCLCCPPTALSGATDPGLNLACWLAV